MFWSPLKDLVDCYGGDLNDVLVLGDSIYSNKIWFHKPRYFVETRQSRPTWEHLFFDKKISLWKAKLLESFLVFGKSKTEDSNKFFGLVMEGGREDLQGFGPHSELFSIFLNHLKKEIV